PTTCKWCDTPTSLNAFDREGREVFASADRHGAELSSDVMAYGVSPALALGLTLAASLDDTRGHSAKWRARRYGIDVLLISEATATTLSVMQLSKFASQRRRPTSIDEPIDGTRAV